MEPQFEILNLADDGTIPNSRYSSRDFGVVGAYPGGAEPDLVKLDDPRPDGVRFRVDSVPVPGLDPLYGDSGLIHSWRESPER